MGVGAGAENELQQDQDAEPCHGQKERVPVDDYFAIQPLLGEPDEGEESGACLEDERRTMAARLRRRRGPNISNPKVP